MRDLKDLPLFKIFLTAEITWVVNLTNVIGLIAALVGLMAVVMLVCIRWEDFTKSKPYRWLAAKFAK